MAEAHFSTCTTTQFIKHSSLYILVISTMQELKRQEIEWKEDWFRTRTSSTFWTPENLRIYFDSIAKKAGIKNPIHWGQVTWEYLLLNSAGAIYNQYRGSLINALQDAYPDITWNEEWFKRRGYWKERKNQLKMIERIAHQLNVTKPSDWGRVTIQMVNEKGGKVLFKQLGYSLFGILRKIYPDVEWKREWFPNISKFPKEFWDSKSSQRAFLDTLRIEYKLNSVDDWKRVTLSLIKKKGGQGILAKYHNSLKEILMNTYPGENWSHVYIDKSEAQAAVLQSTRTLLTSRT